jgi:hypothetical protein
MRKTTLTAVLIYIGFMIMWLSGILGTAGQAVDPGRKVRIVSSLGEAVRRPEGPLLLVFFSLECPVCWAELFEMKYFVEKNSIPVEYIGICLESDDDLEPFLAKYSFYYPVVSDRSKELYRRFKVRLEPHRIVLQNGRVLFQDDASEDFAVRKEKIVRCLLEIASRSPA